MPPFLIGKCDGRNSMRVALHDILWCRFTYTTVEQLLKDNKDRHKHTLRFTEEATEIIWKVKKENVAKKTIQTYST